MTICIYTTRKTFTFKYSMLSDSDVKQCKNVIKWTKKCMGTEIEQVDFNSLLRLFKKLYEVKFVGRHNSINLNFIKKIKKVSRFRIAALMIMT